MEATILCCSCLLLMFIYISHGVANETVAENATKEPIVTSSVVVRLTDKSSSTLRVLAADDEDETNETAASPAASTATHYVDEVLESDGHPWWYRDAIRDIAYYLRAHKFNEFDRRYNRNGTGVERTNFQYFPRPPLRALHWEVHRYCDVSFLHCVDYLRKKLARTALRRQDDTSIVAQESNFGSNASKMISQIDMECRRMRKIDNDVAVPFEGPLERYQWRTTASYFMCWYTMNEVPDLKQLGEHCDNFAYCLDQSTGPNNDDVRANDSVPFACAQYSFCPDPCCPNKHLPRKEFCWRDEKNPCFHENPEGQRDCGFNRSENRDFSDMILNRWNVTCRCNGEGTLWNSLYGICVDVDECADPNLNKCTSEGQACLNLPGSYMCVCKWGYYYDDDKKMCVISGAISEIKLSSKPMGNDTEQKNKWKLFMRTVLKVIGKPSLSGKCSVLSTFVVSLGIVSHLILYDFI